MNHSAANRVGTVAMVLAALQTRDRSAHAQPVDFDNHFHYQQFMHFRSGAKHILFCLALLGTTGCGSTSETSTSGSGGGGTASDTYAFSSRFTPGESAVSHAGQAFRHVLISGLSGYIGGMTEAIDSDAFNPTDPAVVLLALDYYYRFDGATSGEDSHGVLTTPAAIQTSFADVGSDKALSKKMAGNDAVTDHQDWSSAFVGWSDGVIAENGGNTSSPEGLLEAFFATLAKNAVDRENGIMLTEPGTTTPIGEVYVTATGLDLRQLSQKLLLMGITYSQGTDDYLDVDVPDKGLLSPNAEIDEKPYSALGHSWDEGFGYFGSARDYVLYSDDEIASKDGREDWQGHHDSDGDGAIDLLSEINWGAAVNAAKRDRDSGEPTDFSADAFSAFHSGRGLILSAGDTLSDTEQQQLEAYAAAAVGAWERALAATVIHYINEVVVDTNNIGSDDYVFLDAAKHWSELKGFSLGLQFNPRSQLGGAKFAQFHSLVGDAPVLTTAPAQDQASYVADLMSARDLIATAYTFAESNVEGW